MITMIAAVAKDSGIGKDGGLLCHLPADLKRFKALTMGHAILMGRKTYESLPKMLPGRHHIVLTGQPDYTNPKEATEKLTICHTMDEVRDIAKHEDCYIIGGASLYKEFLDDADRLELTEIDGIFDADTYFPVVNPKNWHEAQRSHYTKDEKNPYDYDFVTYVRI